MTGAEDSKWWRVFWITRTSLWYDEVCDMTGQRSDMMILNAVYSTECCIFNSKLLNAAYSTENDNTKFCRFNWILSIFWTDNDDTECCLFNWMMSIQLNRLLSIYWTDNDDTEWCLFNWMLYIQLQVTACCIFNWKWWLAYWMLPIKLTMIGYCTVCTLSIELVYTSSIQEMHFGWPWNVRWRSNINVGLLHLRNKATHAWVKLKVDITAGYNSLQFCLSAQNRSCWVHFSFRD